MSAASPTELVRLLAHPNGWCRDTAQRLLVERKPPAAISLLRNCARDNPGPLARLHALYTLHGLDALDDPSLDASLRDTHPRIREHALRLAESRLGANARLLASMWRLAVDPDAGVRFQWALTLGEVPGAVERVEFVEFVHKYHDDRWIGLAILSSAGPGARGLVQELARLDAGYLRWPSEAQYDFYYRAGRLIGGESEPSEVRRWLSWLFAEGSEVSPGGVVLLAGLAEGLAVRDVSLKELLAAPAADRSAPAQDLAELMRRVAHIALDASRPLTLRKGAVDLLSLGDADQVSATLEALLLPGQPPVLEQSAARSLADLDELTACRRLYAQWPRYTGSVRRAILSASPRSTSARLALLQALEQDTVMAIELPAEVEAALKQDMSEPYRQRLTTVLGHANGLNPGQVVSDYQDVLSMTGSPARGAALAKEHCLACHKIVGIGTHVGPDLSGISRQPKDTALADILDPSSRVSADFVAYSVITTSGTISTGLITAETPASVTLRMADGEQRTIRKVDIEELRASGKSFMPDGIERKIDRQGLADLLAFLWQPERELLQEKEPGSQREE